MSVQTWPEDALEIQPKRSSSSESQTPMHWEERSTSASATAAANDESSHPHTELKVRMLMTKHLLFHSVKLAQSQPSGLHAFSDTLQAIRSIYA